MTEYCVCGHRLGLHVGWEGEPTGCCGYIDDRLDYLNIVPKECPCTKFKLNNLRYIEDTAKQKGLV